MRVLVACEHSGVVRDAFRAQGHEAWSCDLLCGDSEYHLQGDALTVSYLNALVPVLGWDLMIAHPPCTYICNSGVRWLHTDPDRWDKLDEACAFFKKLLDAPIAHIAIENPIPHKYAVERIGQQYTQIVQPWQHGHGETKATCLWLQGLPELTPTEVVEGRVGRIHRMSPSPERGRQRSITYTGIASAMAAQWGGVA
tara:strand:+ start:779 stop:1369 length:591 start_codon:yes stop_codon:yes gene_type:complete